MKNKNKRFGILVSSIFFALSAFCFFAGENTMSILFTLVAIYSLWVNNL